MGTPAPAVYASGHEQTWVERFVSYGGGGIDAAKAAYRRTYPHGVPAVPQESPPAHPAIESPRAEKPSTPLSNSTPAEVIALPPRTTQFVQQALDLDTVDVSTMGQCLDKQAASELTQPDPVLQQELGFVTSAMIFAALPHKAVKSGIYKRTDALVTLSVMNDPDIGIPYGRYPRLLLAHICTLAKRSGERRIVLGDNQADFMRRLGLNPDGMGKRGQVSLVKNSAIQLFTAAIRWRENGENKFNFKNIEVASQGSLIWTPHSSTGGIENYEWQGFIDLSESFFNQCIQHSFPIDLNVVQALRSSVAIDIYIWLTYKMNVLNKPVKITWRQLKFQFGSEYTDTPLGIKNFKAKFSAQLKLVLEHYNVNLQATSDYLELRPSNTHIPRFISR